MCCAESRSPTVWALVVTWFVWPSTARETSDLSPAKARDPPPTARTAAPAITGTMARTSAPGWPVRAFESSGHPGHKGHGTITRGSRTVKLTFLRAPARVGSRRAEARGAQPCRRAGRDALPATAVHDLAGGPPAAPRGRPAAAEIAVGRRVAEADHPHVQLVVRHPE